MISETIASTAGAMPYQNLLAFCMWVYPLFKFAQVPPELANRLSPPRGSCQ